MKNSKVISILKTFNEKEWKNCRKYLKSQFKADSKDLVLFKLLFAHRNKLDSNKLNIEYLQTSIELGLSTRKNIQNIMSRLTKQIEKFLVFQSLEDDEVEQEFRLFQVFNNRGLFKYANNYASRLVTSWDNSDKLDIKYLDYIRQVLHSQYFSNNPLKYDRKKILIDELLNSSFTQYKIQFLLYNFARTLEENSNFISSADKLELKLSASYSSNTLLTIIEHLNEIEQNSSKSSFDFLYQTLLDSEQVSDELRAIIFRQCESYLMEFLKISRYNEENKKILELYEYGVEEGLLTYKEKMSPVKFQNIIQVACYLFEFGWAENFQTKFGSLVPLDIVDENSNITKIKIDFGKKLYSELITNILKFDFKFFMFKAQARWYLICSQFIIHDNFEFFESQLTNFTQFVYYNKSKLSQTNFEGSLNLAKIFKSNISKYNFSLEEETKKYKYITFKNRLPEFFAERKRYVKENGIVV